MQGRLQGTIAAVSRDIVGEDTLHWRTMFPYDPELLAIAQKTPSSVAEVLATMRAIQATCVDGDGLKWFNGLYFEVTQAVEARIEAAPTEAGGFGDPDWLAALDVQFASLYFVALARSLSGQPAPECWQLLLERRGETQLARLQFAMAGINAHINHDLCEALVATCAAAGTGPQRGSLNYADYTALNSTLDSLIDTAKAELHVRLLGEVLPAAAHLEDAVAAWNVGAAREAAWQNAEILWHLRDQPVLSSSFLDSLDGLTSLAGKTLMIPAP